MHCITSTTCQVAHGHGAQSINGTIASSRKQVSIRNYESSSCLISDRIGGLEYVWYDSQSSQLGSTGSEFYHNVPMSANKYEPGPQAATGRETLGYLPHSVDYTYTSSASASSSGNAYTVPRASSEENMTPAGLAPAYELMVAVLC